MNDARPDKAHAVGINHVALEVGDIREALDFYGRFLSFTVEEVTDEMAIVYFGDQFINFIRNPDRRPDTMRHFGIAVDDKPLAPLLATIRNIKNCREAAALMGRQNDGYAFIFEISINQDPKAPQSYAVFLNAVGLGLPDRDYYLKDAFAAKKAAYQAYVQQMLDMIGWQDPADNAKAIVAFETRLAEASWTRAQLRDSDKTYHPVTMAELKALGSDFEWDAFLSASGLPKINRAIVTSDTAIPKYTSAFASTPLPVLRAWFAFRLTDRYAWLLSRRFADAQFAFMGKQLGGMTAPVARWRRAVAFTNDVLGQSVGRVYVARYFPPAAKTKIDAMVADIRKAMQSRIAQQKRFAQK